MANKKPARKGGARKPAPKQLTERQIDQFNADKMRADAFASTQSARQVVEDQDEVLEAMRQKPCAACCRESIEFGRIDWPAAAKLCGLKTEHWADGHGKPAAKKPTLWHRSRSAITGLFVSKQYAEANPDTTVREKAD